MSIRCLTKSTNTSHDKEGPVENDVIHGPLDLCKSTGRLSTNNACVAHIPGIKPNVPDAHHKISSWLYIP